MVITHLELEDWGPHKKLDLDMDSHIVGIMGSNGKGKSNLLQAVAYALTGDLDNTKGTSYIRNFGQEGAAKKAVVKLSFRKGQEIGTITRTIRENGTTTRQLDYMGETFKSAADVEKRMSEILGADKAAMQNAVYIKQGDIDRLVKGTPSERQDTILKLMNLSFVEQRAENIRKKIFTLKAGIKDYTGMKDIVDQAIKEDDAAMEAAENDMKANAGCHGVVEYLNTLSTLIGKRRDADQNINLCNKRIAEVKHSMQELMGGKTEQEIEKNVETAQEAHNKYVVLLEKVKAAFKMREYTASLQERKNILEQEIKEHESNVNSVEDIRTQNENYEKAKIRLTDASNRDAALMKLAAVRDRKDAVTVNIKTVANETMEMENSILGMQPNIESLTKAITIAELCVSEVCPICGGYIDFSIIKKSEEELSNNRSSLSAAKKEIERLNTVISENKAAMIGLTAELSSLDSEETSLKFELEKIVETEPVAKLSELVSSTYERLKHLEEETQALEAAKGRLKEVEESLNKAAPLDPELENVDEQSISNIEFCANDQLTKFNEAKDLLLSVKGAESRLKTESDLKERYLSEYESICNDIESLMDGKPEGLPDGEMPDAIVAELTAKNKQGALEFIRSQEAFKIASASKDAHTVRLAEIQKEIDQNNERITLIEDMQAVLALTSRSGVPLAYANAVFKSITPEVQALLSTMQANFTVEPDPDRPLTYNFIRVDDQSGYVMPQERLSGGQAIRLSIAILAACQQSILPEVGMLILDEPSSHIDSEGVEHMRDMFIHMESILENTNMQLIVVDHNTILSAAFDKTIEL